MIDDLPEVVVEAVHTVYFYFDADDQLLYVGVTGQAHWRARQHNSTSRWWPLVAYAKFEHYSDPQEALDAERRAIELLKPLYNIRHNGIEAPLPVPEANPLHPAPEGKEVAADGISALWGGYVDENDKRLRRKWGIKLDQWMAIRRTGDPNGGCAACGATSKRLYVDSDAETSEIFGALCLKCKSKLSARAKNYVVNPPARAVARALGVVGFFVPPKRRRSPSAP